MKVEKAMTPDQATMFDNIESILSEIKTMMGGGETSTPPAITNTPAIKAEETKPIMPEKTEEEKKKEEMEKAAGVKKDIHNDTSDGVTARDKAEDQVEGVLNEETLANIDEVKKALEKISSIVSKGQVKKTQTDSVVSAISDLTKVVKQLAEDNQAVQKSIVGIYEGLGVKKMIDSDLETAKKAQQEKISQPIIDQDNDRILKALRGLITGNGQNTNDNGIQKSNAEIVKNNLGDKDLWASLLSASKNALPIAFNK